MSWYVCVWSMFTTRRNCLRTSQLDCWLQKANQLHMSWELQHENMMRGRPECAELALGYDCKAFSENRIPWTLPGCRISMHDKMRIDFDSRAYTEIRPDPRYNFDIFNTKVLWRGLRETGSIRNLVQNDSDERWFQRDVISLPTWIERYLGSFYVAPMHGTNVRLFD